MSNDNKTMADVQPGGRVRLEQEPRDHRWDDVGERCLDCGDKDWMGGACSGPRAPEITAPWSPIGMAPNDGEPHIRGLWVTSRIDGAPATRKWRQFIGLVNDDGAFVDPYYGETFGWEADQFDAWMPLADAPGAALSAQPSPGSQEDAGRIAVEFIAAANFDVPDGYVVEEHLPGIWHYTFTDAGEKMASCASWNNKAHATIAAWQAALAARQPVGDQHPDDLAVDAFAAAMKAKMAEARAKGRGGWEDPTQCSADDLTRMLRDHVEKGDPRDVANFCMMLHQRGEAIAARQPVGEHWQHIANEWADAATNGVQWLRNIRDGASTVADALACMESNVERIQQLKPPAQAVDLGAVRKCADEAVEFINHGYGGHARRKIQELLALIDSQAVGNG